MSNPFTSSSGTLSGHWPSEPPTDPRDIAEFERHYGRLGASRFLHDLRCVGDPNAVRLQLVGDDAYDVVLRLDGAYIGRQHAETMLTWHAARVAAVARLLQVESLRGGPHR
jgi:hypothetical protein